MAAAQYGDPRHLLPANYKRLIAAWLEEDCPSFDYGGFVVGESEGEARLLGKSNVPLPSLPLNAMHISDRDRASSPASPSSTRSLPNWAARTPTHSPPILQLLNLICNSECNGTSKKASP